MPINKMRPLPVVMFHSLDEVFTRDYWAAELATNSPGTTLSACKFDYKNVRSAFLS